MEICAVFLATFARVPCFRFLAGKRKEGREEDLVLFCIPYFWLFIFLLN